MRGMETYRLRVSKEALAFSAAHFLTFSATKCARLHGHNYRVAITVEGVTNRNGYVLDFGDVKRLASQICAEVDHFVLVPMNPDVVTIERGQDDVIVGFLGKKYRFPQSDVCFLPIANTTTECLARWFADRLGVAFAEEVGESVTAFEIEVEESAGQSASVRAEMSNFRETTRQLADAHPLVVGS